MWGMGQKFLIRTQKREPSNKMFAKMSEKSQVVHQFEYGRKQKRS